MPIQTQAYVARGPPGAISTEPLMKLEDVYLSDLQDDSVLIEIVAVGVCHTDIKAAQGQFLQKPPLIPGHEGSGYVKAIGSNVTCVEPGDAVVLSYASCMSCRFCESGRNAYCDRIIEWNFSGRRLDGSVAVKDENGRPLNGLFFGQSSMGRLAVVHENSCVKVDATREELKTLATLGCGIQTGFGCVLNVCKPTANSTFLVFGAGAVGIAALHAASTTSAAHLILVDTSEQKLAMSATNIATHKIHSPLENPVDIPHRVSRITGGKGADFAIDAVGSPEVLRVGQKSLAKLGVLVTVGSAPTNPGFDIREHLQKGITYRGTHQGDAVARESIPYLVDLWRKGKLPLGDVVRRYPFENMERALEDIKGGKVIKAVLVC